MSKRRFGVLPLWFVTHTVSGSVAVSVCGLSGLWSFRFVAFRLWLFRRETDKTCYLYEFHPQIPIHEPHSGFPCMFQSLYQLHQAAKFKMQEIQRILTNCNQKIYGFIQNPLTIEFANHLGTTGIKQSQIDRKSLYQQFVNRAFTKTALGPSTLLLKLVSTLKIRFKIYRLNKVFW